VIRNYIEMPSQDTIKQLEKLRDNHGGSTVKGLIKFPVVLDS
jgi:hypothetical protein